MQKHKKEVQDQDSCSLLDTTDTTVFPGLEHMTNTEIFQEMTKVPQSTQLTSTGKKRNARDSDNEEEEEDKWRKLERAVVPELSQTQGEKERQEVRGRTLATVSRKLQEGALSESRRLLEENSEKPELLPDTSHEGDSQLLITAQETIPMTPVDSLSLSSFQTNEEDTEIKSLEDRLKTSDDSLKQALAKIAKLEEGEGPKIRTIEFLENKNKDIKDSTETIHALTDQVDKADDAYHETEGNRKREEREREVNTKEEEKRKKKDEETKRKEEEEEKRAKATKEENRKEKMMRKRKNRKLRKTGDSTVASTGMEVDDDSTEGIPQPEINKKKKKELPTKSRKPGATNSDASNDQGKPKAPSSALTRPQRTPQLDVSQPPIALHPDLSRPPPSFGPFQPSGPQIPTSFDFNQDPRIHKGTVEIQALMNQEAALKQLLFEQSF